MGKAEEPVEEKESLLPIVPSSENAFSQAALQSFSCLIAIPKAALAAFPWAWLGKAL